MLTKIVNPWKEDRWISGVLGMLMGFLGVSMCAGTGDWLPGAFMILFSAFWVAVFWIDYPHAILNEAGVTYRFFLRRCFLPWAEFRQAGIYLSERKKPGGIVERTCKLGLLMPGGFPKKPGQRLRCYKNVGRVIYLPDTPEIRAFVIAHYGLLDFDESADPNGYSIVAD